MLCGLIVAAVVVIGGLIFIVFAVKKKSKKVQGQSPPRNDEDRSGRYVNLRPGTCIQQVTSDGDIEQIYHSINSENFVNTKLDQMNEAWSPTKVPKGHHLDQMNESCSSTKVLKGYHPDQPNETCSPIVLQGCIGNQSTCDLYKKEVDLSDTYLTTRAIKSKGTVTLGGEKLKGSFTGNAKYWKEEMQPSLEKHGSMQKKSLVNVVDLPEFHAKSLRLDDDINDVKTSIFVKENDYLIPQKSLLPCSVTTCEGRLDPIGQEQQSMNDPLDDERQGKCLALINATGSHGDVNAYEEPVKRLFMNKMYFNGEI